MHKKVGFKGVEVIPNRAPNTLDEPLYFLYYSEARFYNPHYQSVRPKSQFMDTSFFQPPAESTNIKENSVHLNNSSEASTLPPNLETNNLMDDITVTNLKIWGKLEAVRSQYYKSIDLTEDVFKFGRNHNSDLISNKFPKELKAAISKVHFRIEQNGENVLLYDQSSFGTYVNDVLVGKNNSKKLENGSEIALVTSNIVAYKFLSNLGKNKSNNSSNASTIPPPTMIENTIPDFDSPVQFSNDQKITEKVKVPKRSQSLKRKLNKSISPKKRVTRSKSLKVKKPWSENSVDSSNIITGKRLRK